MTPNEARRIFVPTNPDLADIVGRTDLNFEILYVLCCFLDPKFPDFQVPTFTDSQTDAWARPGLAGAPLRDTSGPQSW